MKTEEIREAIAAHKAHIDCLITDRDGNLFERRLSDLKRCAFDEIRTARTAVNTAEWELKRRREHLDEVTARRGAEISKLVHEHEHADELIDDHNAEIEKLRTHLIDGRSVDDLVDKYDRMQRELRQMEALIEQAGGRP